MKDTDLAWLGGIWDGEGSISLFQSKEKNGTFKIRPVLTVVNTDIGIVNNIQKILLRTENYILTYNILDKEKSKTNKLLALKEKQEYIEENFQKGCANKSLDVEEFNLMKIPIPSIEIQEEIIEYCDNNLIIIENLNKTIEENYVEIKEDTKENEIVEL